MADTDTEILYKELERSPSTFLLKQFTGFFSGVMTIVRSLVTEEVKVSGLENILENDEVKPGPFLWLPKHDSWNDIYNIVPLWKDIGKPVAKAVSRRKIMGDTIGSPIIKFLLSPVAIEVYRTWLDEGLTEDEEKAMKAENWKRIANLRNHFDRGMDAVIFPEGTTKTDGRISEIKSGAYNLSKIEREDGSLDLIQCVPVGTTYDFLAGDTFLGKKRDLVFFSVGEIFTYEAVEREEEETAKQWVKRDIAHLAQRIENYLIDLNTYTTSQLAGDYIVTAAEEGVGCITLDELDSVLKQRVNALSTVESAIIDEALLEEETRTTRLERFYNEIVKMDYITQDGTLNTNRILLEPSEGETYKKENILLYSVNRLRGIMDKREEITSAIDNSK